MQWLQRTARTIAGQLAGLSSSAKLLIGSLMVILAMSLFLVSLYAGRPTMAPLGLKASVSNESRSRVVEYLQSRGMTYEEREGDLYVPIERKHAVLAQLTEGRLINADQINFDTLMKDTSPFLTRDQSRQRYLVAKMNVLASMISQMRGISRASVVIDQPEGPVGFGRANIAPSASVTVQPDDRELSQAQVDAIANLVAGSHAGLKPANVKVIDARTGRVMDARNDETISAGKYLEVKLAAEQHARNTLERALNYIPNVIIAVNAQVDTKQVVQQSSKYGEPKMGITSERSDSTTSSSGAPSAEPGVRSNTGMSLAAPARAASQTSQERTETAAVPVVDKTDSQIRDSKGYPLQINATIGVPKSYFVNMLRDRGGAAESGEGAAQDPAALDAIVAQETDRIRASIAPLIETSALEGAMAGVVTVSMVPDFARGSMYSETTAPPAMALQGAGGGSVNDGLVKYLSLGGLAILSLAMMFLMVRKASVRDELPTAAELVGIPPALAAAEADLVGEADEAAPALEGVELNDDAIRRQQMILQISEMVTNSPDDAANLMRRWIRSEA